MTAGIDPAAVRLWLENEITVNGPLAGEALGKSLRYHGVDPDAIALWAAHLIQGALK